MQEHQRQTAMSSICSAVHYRKLALGPWGAVTPCRVKPWGRALTPLQGAFNESFRTTARFYPFSTGHDSMRMSGRQMYGVKSSDHRWSAYLGAIA